MSGNTGSVRSTFIKRATIGLLAGVVAVTLAMSDADARRLGGGRSFGTQSQSVQRSMAAPAPAPVAPAANRAAPAPAATPAPAAQPPRNRWMGPLAGLAAGLGIAALLSHFGLAGAFAGMLSNLLVVALLAFVAIWVVRALMRRFGPAQPTLATGDAQYRRPDAPAYGGNAYPGGAGTAAPASAYAGYAEAAGAAAALPAIPAGFDTDGVLREAKVLFIRLQAAWDRGDMADINSFTTPEMYANTKLDLGERGSMTNRTDVVQLDASLLAVEQVHAEWLASVRFSGLIRETEGASAEPFAEVWNLTRNVGRTDGWLLAGIQQVN